MTTLFFKYMSRGIYDVLHRLLCYVTLRVYILKIKMCLKIYRLPAVPVGWNFLVAGLKIPVRSVKYRNVVVVVVHFVTHIDVI